MALSRPDSRFGPDYSKSSIKDRNDLCHILRDAATVLEAFECIHKEWRLVRKKTIDHFEMLADELDGIQKIRSVVRKVGKGASFISIAAAAAAGEPKVGVSLVAAGIAGSLGVCSGIHHVYSDRKYRSLAEELIKEDKSMTIKLKEKLTDLCLHIGYLGEWHHRTGGDIINFTVHDMGNAITPTTTEFLREYSDSKLNHKTVGGNNAMFAIANDVLSITFVDHDLLYGSKTTTLTTTLTKLRDIASKLKQELEEMKKMYDKVKHYDTIFRKDVAIAALKETIAHKDAENDSLEELIVHQVVLLNETIALKDMQISCGLAEIVPLKETIACMHTENDALKELIVHQDTLLNETIAVKDKEISSGLADIASLKETIACMDTENDTLKEKIIHQDVLFNEKIVLKDAEIARGIVKIASLKEIIAHKNAEDQTDTLTKIIAEQDALLNQITARKDA